MIVGYFVVKEDTMFHDPIRSTPLVQDISDITLRLKVQRADSALFAVSDMRLPHLRVM
jgi:hypothetical protein